MQNQDFFNTTGGIGPTHDDITSKSVAKAFGKKYEYNNEVHAILEKYYANSDFNEGRKKMAKMPEGATLIYNKEGSAPAFSVENVFVLPGISSYVELMPPQLKKEINLIKEEDFYLLIFKKNQ